MEGWRNDLPLRVSARPAMLMALTRVLKTGVAACTMLPLGGSITAFSSWITPLDAIWSTRVVSMGAHWAVIWKQ